MKIRPRSIDYRSQLCESISEPCFQNDLIIDGCLISDDDDDENLKDDMNPAASVCIDRTNEDCDDSKSIPEFDIILPEVTKRPIQKRRKLSQKKRPIDSEINMASIKEEKALNFLSDEKDGSNFPTTNHAEQSAPTEIVDDPTDDAFGTADGDDWSMEVIDTTDSTTASTVAENVRQSQNLVAENVGQSQNLVVSSLQNRDTNQPLESNQLIVSFGSFHGTESYRPSLSLRLSYCNAAQWSDLPIRRLLQNSVMLANQSQMANFRYQHCLPMAPMNENEAPSSKCQALVVYKPSKRVQRRESQLTSTDGSQPCLTPENMLQLLYFLFMTYGHRYQNVHGPVTYDASNPLEDEVPEQDVNEIQTKIQSNTVEESVFVDVEVQRSLKDPKLTDKSSSPLQHCENDDWHGDCDEVMETSKSDLDEKSLESNGCNRPNGDADETLSSSSPMEAPVGDEENILHEWNEHSHTSLADFHDFQPDDKADDESSWKSQSPEDDEDYPNRLNEYSYKSTQQYKQHSVPSISPAMKTTVDFQRHRPNHNYSNGQQSTQSKEHLNTTKPTVQIGEQDSSKHWKDKSGSQSKYNRSEKEFHNQTKHDEQKGHTKKMQNTQAEDRNNVSYSGPGENQSIVQPKKRKIGTVAENEHESLFHEDDFVGLNSGKRRLEASSFPSRESRKGSVSKKVPNIDNNDPMRPVDAFEHYQQRPSNTTNTIIPPKVGQYLSSATTVSTQNQRAFQAAQYTLLCAESFLEKFSEAAAELCSGRWMQLQNLNERGNSARIHLMDTSLLDEISVEIELPDFSAIAIIDSASLVHSNPTVIKDIVKRFVQLGSTGRYESVHILLSCSNISPLHHHQFQSNLALLQNAIFKQPGCPCQRFSVQFVSRKTLAVSIMKIAESHGLFKESIDPLNQDDTFDVDFQLQVRFLLNIAPTLTCRNALLLIRGYGGCFGQLLHDVILTTDERQFANVLLERGIEGIREVSLRQLCCAMNVSLVG